jgi:hypothetical protein
MPRRFQPSPGILGLDPGIPPDLSRLMARDPRVKPEDDAVLVAAPGVLRPAEPR